jgi:hypothetical protein
MPGTSPASPRLSSYLRIPSQLSSTSPPPKSCQTNPTLPPFSLPLTWCAPNPRHHYPNSTPTRHPNSSKSKPYMHGPPPFDSSRPIDRQIKPTRTSESLLHLSPITLPLHEYCRSCPRTDRQCIEISSYRLQELPHLDYPAKASEERMKVPVACLLVILASAMNAHAQAPNLQTTGNFAVLAGAAVARADTGTTVVGSAGSSATPTVTGLLATQIIGTLYTSPNAF